MELDGIANDCNRHIEYPGNLFDRPFRLNCVSQRNRWNPGFRRDRLAESPVGVNHYGFLSMERSPAGYRIVLNIEVFEGLLNNLLEYVLLLLEVEEVCLGNLCSGSLYAFEKDCSTVRLKPTCGKRAVIFRAVPCIFEAITDGEKANPSIKERLYESKLN